MIERSDKKHEKLTFTGKRITGVFDYFAWNRNTFMRMKIAKEPEENRRLKRLKRIMGYGKRRRAKETTTVSDMILYGAKKLIQEGKIKKEEIGAVVVVTLSPDYFCPTVSAIVQGELGLTDDVLCVDIPQACAGYVVGLMQSFMLLEHMEGKKSSFMYGRDFLPWKQRKTGTTILQSTFWRGCSQYYNCGKWRAR